MIRNGQRWLKKRKQKNEPSQSELPDLNPQQPSLSIHFDENVAKLRSVYEHCSDIVFRSFLIFGKIRAVLIYMEGLSNTEGMEAFVLAPLMQEAAEKPEPLNEWLNQQLPISKLENVNTLTACIESILSGNPILLYEGAEHGVSLGLAKWEKRAIEEPAAEAGIRGSREGFNECLQVSIAQLRRIIKSPSLKTKSMNIGRYTKTAVVVTYIEGIADQTLIDEIVNRLKRIDIDGILESGYIEEMIEDNPYSPFPQILSTERPDVVCSNMLEGRAAILVEGTPFVLIAPTSFFSLFQSHEDYYQRFMIGSFIRWLRYSFLVISLILPSFYIAVLTFHHEMVPASLLLSIASAREAVPFPAIVEALIMEIAFEALREAGVRLPKQVGAAVSIVGALVIGQAAVQAGLVSAPMVIVVAITGIASFMVPHYIAGISIRVLRFPMMLFASTLGLLGIMMGVIAIAIHLCSLRSFGVPYLTPLAPLKGRELKDVLWRAPWWMMDTRPHLTGEVNLHRQSKGQGPDPAKGGETP